MSDLSAEFSKGTYFDPAESSNSKRCNNNPSTSSSFSIPRSNGRHFQGYSDVDVGSPSAHDPQTAYVSSMSEPSHFMPYIHQNSPRRSRQQPIQQFYHGRSHSFRGSDWSRMKVHPQTVSLHSGSSSFQNGMRWGKNADYPITGIPPTSRERKDYGRIV